MADTEKKKIIAVDAKSVKELRKQISDLKDAITEMTVKGEKGTRKYADAVDELIELERINKEVMGLTKKETIALEGSYDALVAEMKRLKTEWRATNDEARRSELRERIDEINTELKELDASIGNHQRNVGNYKDGLVETNDALRLLKEEIKQAKAELLAAEEGTEEYAKAMQKLAEAQFKVRDMNEQSRYAVADLGEQLNNVVGIASGVASGFSALQGVMALTGAESEEFEEVMIRLQSAMAIVQGLQGLEGMIDKVKGLGTVIKTLTKTMGKGGWIGIIIAVVAALATLAVWLIKNRRAMADGAYSAKEYAKALKEARTEAYSSAADEIAQLKALEAIATRVYATNAAMNASYTTRARAADIMTKKLEMEINEENRAAIMAGKYKTSIENLTDALLQQAEATAALQVLTDKYVALFEAQIAGKSERKLRKLQEDIDGFLVAMTARLATSSGIVDQAFKETGDEIIDGFVKKLNKSLTGMEREHQKTIANIETSDFTDDTKARKLYETNIKYFDETIAKMQKTRDEMFKNGQSMAMDEESFWNEIDAIEAQIAETQIARQRAVYDEKVRLRELDEEKEEKYRNNMLTLLDNAHERRLRLIEVSDKTEEEKAEEAYNEEIVYQGDRLAMLRTFLKEALKDKEKNKDLIFDLQQQIADGMVAIDEANYAERERLMEEHLEEMAKKLDEYNTEAEHKQRKIAITDYVDFEGVRNKRDYDALNEVNSRAQADAAFEAEQEELMGRIELLKGFMESAKLIGADEQVLEYAQQIADAELEIEESKYANMKRLREQDLADAIQAKEDLLDLTTTGMEATSNILNAIADMNEKNAEANERAFENNKALRISATIVDGLAAGIKAFATAPNYIIGAIQAASIAATTAASVIQIKNTKFSATASGTVSTPNASLYENNSNLYSYNRQLTGAEEYKELNRDARVYILESDIQNSNKRVQVREDETSW